MVNSQRVARALGLLFLAVGVIGWFVEDVGGLVHFDALHNTLHLLVGLGALHASTREAYALRFQRLMGVLFLGLGATGFFTPHLGAMHLKMSENLFHLIIGAITSYIGFVTGTGDATVTANKSA